MSILTELTLSDSASQYRLKISHLLNKAAAQTIDNGSDVVRGLTSYPKSLPPHYFYDHEGSLLFEAICELPEYYPTRTEAAILENSALEIAKLTGACEIVELGSGSSTKTRLLFNAYQALGYPLRYQPIDVSASILEISAKQLLADYPSLQIHGLVSTYEIALQNLSHTPLPHRLVCFLGSTLGNFSQEECDEFFAQITIALEKGDYFLLGVDLQKPVAILEAAYNDTQGITAEFNLNMLRHLNWRFSGNFNVDWFEHQAFYNQSAHQIEMHLRARRSHTVYLKDLALAVEFRQGETIHTEISRKFALPQIQSYLRHCGLTPIHTWTDTQKWFGLILCRW